MINEPDTTHVQEGSSLCSVSDDELKQKINHDDYLGGVTVDALFCKRPYGEGLLCLEPKTTHLLLSITLPQNIHNQHTVVFVYTSVGLSVPSRQLDSMTHQREESQIHSAPPQCFGVILLCSPAATGAHWHINAIRVMAMSQWRSASTAQPNTEIEMERQ